MGVNYLRLQKHASSSHGDRERPAREVGRERERERERESGFKWIIRTSMKINAQLSTGGMFMFYHHILYNTFYIYTVY